MATYQAVKLPRDQKVSEAFKTVGTALAILGNEVCEMERYLRDSRARARQAEPTWTSTDGETHRVSEMPTRYLKNVAALLARRGLSSGPGCGLYDAIQRELETRQDDEAIGY